ncbi:MAG: SEC-C metal-binding domain-containing protein [Desulfobacterales bacterium]
MAIGRNQPCPCGSGKKYKKCCLNEAAAPSLGFYYRRLSEAHDGLVKHLMACADRIFGEQAVHAAMHEFLLWPKAEEDLSEDTLDRAGSLFWPWYLFNWEYQPEDAAAALAGPKGRTVAELYSQERGVRLDSLENRLIDNINRKPYSFWEVLRVEKGKGMALLDILTGTQIEIQERSGSEYVHPGDLLFGRAVTVDGVGMLIGLSPTIIPPGRKTDIIELRKQLHRRNKVITDNTLSEYDTEIRQVYFELDRSLHAAPQMQNTDGHALEFHRLIYEVRNTEEAFEKLCDLCATMTPKELSADAERDDAGRMVRVEIPWGRRGHKKVSELPNTILGRITIDGRRLAAEVNSAERAAALRREIDARLGGAGRFKVDEIQNLDALMNERNSRAAETKISLEQEGLMQQPEVREQVAELMARHWESWVDQKIPALGGKTPREAVKTDDGREAVAALLTDAERDHGQDPFTLGFNRKGAARARKILGLDSPTTTRGAER